MPRGMIEILWTGSVPGSASAHQGVPQLVVGDRASSPPVTAPGSSSRARRRSARPPPAAPARPTFSRPRRAPSSAASLMMLARSAPTNPAVIAAIRSRSTSGVQRHLARVDLEDVAGGPIVGPVDEHLAVEAAGAQQRRVEDLRPVRGRHQDDADARVEAVQLDEQLVQRLLALLVAPPGRRRGPCPARRARR